MNVALQALMLGFRDAITLANLRYFLYALLMVGGAALSAYLLLYEQAVAWLTTIDSSEGWLFWGAGVVLHAILGVLGYLLITPVILMVVSLFSEQIIQNIQRARYPSVSLGEGIPPVVSMGMMGRVFAIYLFGLIVAAPLLLLGIGYLIYFILGYLLFRKLLLLEVLGANRGVEQIQQQLSLGGAGQHRLTTLLLYLMTLLPLLNLFVPYLAVCVVANEMLIKEERGV